MVKLLLERGADINSKDPSDGRTALMCACDKGMVDVAKLLIERGTGVNLKATFGVTALHIVSLKCMSEVAKLLVERGADVNATSDNGFTALSIAVNQNHLQLAAYLRTVGGH